MVNLAQKKQEIILKEWIPKAEAYEHRASEIQFVKPTNSKKNKNKSLSMLLWRKKEKETNLCKTLLPSFQEQHEVFLVILKERI